MRESNFSEVESALRRKFPDISTIRAVDKEDLELKNHLSGLKRRYMRLSFVSVQALLGVRRDLFAIVDRNKKRVAAEGGGGSAANDMSTSSSTAAAAAAAASLMMDSSAAASSHSGVGRQRADWSDHILDMREYDVPYYIRTSIDLDIRVGCWYSVKVDEGETVLELQVSEFAFPSFIFL